MQEIILMVTVVSAGSGMLLVSWISFILMLKDAIQHKDLYIGSLASILLFCVVIPITGIVLSLLF